MSIFDVLALGSIITFIVDVFPEMDWSVARSYYAALAFILTVVGIVSLFAMFHVQALYPTLDAHVENEKEVLDETPKNRRYNRIMTCLKWTGICGVVLGFLGWIVTQVVWGV
ncbi:MAG: hypothetical protein J6T94_05555 [Bacteroidaceae bacterium]|nr:hypothetical protein [Bacteroidaceae bacterium]